MAALDAVLVTNVSSTLTAGTAATGDSLTVRSFPPPAKAHLLSVFGTISSLNATTNGIIEIKSPRLHDAVHGIHLEVANQKTAGAINDPQLLPWAPSPQVLESQDTLEVDIQGDGTATHVDRVVLINYYENLPGVNARLITTQALRQRAVTGQIAGIKVQCATTVGSLIWQSGVAITSTYDTLKANRDYALLGFLVSGQTQVANALLAVSLRSSDTGNLRVCAPASLLTPNQSKDFFVRQSAQYEVYGVNGQDMGMIPVFNASNKGSMIVDVIGTDVALTYDVVALFQLLD